jgi:DNA repair protein RecO (recombination protein O)
MAAPRNYRAEAVILKQRGIGEADRILTLYTLEFGKVRAVAKGVKRPGSKMSGHVDLLTHSQLMLAHGRNLDIVTQAQTVDTFIELKNNLDHLSNALYVAELVDCLTEERLEGKAVFNLLLDTLHRLNDSSQQGSVLRYFELHLAHHLGYRPQLQNCASCETALQPVTNYFHPASGGVLCPECAFSLPQVRPISLNAFKVLRLWQSCDYETACRVRIDTSLSNELEMVMRAYLRFLLEREPKAVAWLDRLKRELTGPTGAAETTVGQS